MAELVELRKERMLPELEQMKRIQLFEDREIKDIIKERDMHSYRIQRLTKNLRDFLHFIKFEKNLVALIRERRKLKHIPQKRANIETAILTRIKILYKQTVQRFPENIQVWDEYIQFCKVYKFGSEVSSILDRMLQFHADKPETWQKAVMWEHEETKNKDRVKHFILGGLQRHPKSEILYFTFIKLKLLEGAQIPDRVEDQKKLIAQAELIYKDGKANVDAIEFVAGVLEIVSQFDFARAFELQVLADMKESYRSSELMWHTLAKRELAGRYLTALSSDKSVSDPDQSRCIELCEEVYTTACELLDTEQMWSYYLETVVEIYEGQPEESSTKQRQIQRAFSTALEKKKITEENFIKFFELVADDDQLYTKDDLRNMLHAATDKYPQSVALWEIKMRFHIEYQETDELVVVFRSALKRLPMNTTYPLWELMVLFYKSNDQFAGKVKGLYREAIALAIAEISNPFKPQLLEHLVQTEGIAAARAEYNKLCLCVPSSLELHQQMARMEEIQERPNINGWRKCHEMATQFFGKDNVDVWLQMINFEKAKGDPKRVSQLYQRAMNSLNPLMVGDFITAYNLNVSKVV